VTFVIGAVAGLDLDWFADARSSVVAPEDAVAPLPPRPAAPIRRVLPDDHVPGEVPARAHP
jgi:hypothetical protein